MPKLNRNEQPSQETGRTFNNPFKDILELLVDVEIPKISKDDLESISFGKIIGIPKEMEQIGCRLYIISNIGTQLRISIGLTTVKSNPLVSKIHAHIIYGEEILDKYIDIDIPSGMRHIFYLWYKDKSIIIDKTVSLMLTYYLSKPQVIESVSISLMNLFIDYVKQYNI